MEVWRFHSNYLFSSRAFEHSVSFDFPVTASNNEVSEVGACFLQLKLTLDQGGGKRESKLMGGFTIASCPTGH